MTESVSSSKPYDVALSFLETDEELVKKVYDLINPRLRAFAYLYEQAQLAGADGQKKFNKIFGEEAKVVVVFYRPKWGSTEWTRVEETAIQNRGLKKGYDFVLLVMLEKCEPPVWLPVSRLWWGYERFGIEGLAGAIEVRVQEAGGDVAEDSAEQKAMRMSREIADTQEKKRILASGEGVALAKKNVDELFKQLEHIAVTTSKSNPDLQMNCERNANIFVIRGSCHSLILNWQTNYANTLQHSALTLRLFKGHIGLGSGIYIEKPTRLREESFQFDLAPVRRGLWRHGASKAYSTNDLVGHSIELLLGQIQKQL